VRATAAAGTSFGVDRTTWPTTLPGARVVLNALPDTLVGQPRKLATDARDTKQASAEYGNRDSITVGGEYVTDDTPTGERVLFHANNILAASFGLGYACADGSYRGTAPKHDDFDGPAPTASRLPAPVWFSCPVDAAEGEDDFSGYAVGWTSGRTAWLVIARDATAAEALVGALTRAAR
jgi:hypothetical protein